MKLLRIRPARQQLQTRLHLMQAYHSSNYFDTLLRLLHLSQRLRCRRLMSPCHPLQEVASLPPHLRWTDVSSLQLWVAGKLAATADLTASQVCMYVTAFTTVCALRQQQWCFCTPCCKPGVRAAPPPAQSPLQVQGDAHSDRT